MKTIPVVLLAFFFILAFDSRSSAASVSGKAGEIHYGAGTASPADQVIVTLYRMNNYLDRPDGPKLGSFITKSMASFISRIFRRANTCSVCKASSLGVRNRGRNWIDVYPFSETTRQRTLRRSS